MKIKAFIQGLVAEGRLLIILALMTACIASAWYVKHHATHPVHHISNAIK